MADQHLGCQLGSIFVVLSQHRNGSWARAHGSNTSVPVILLGLWPCKASGSSMALEVNGRVRRLWKNLTEHGHWPRAVQNDGFGAFHSSWRCDMYASAASMLLRKEKEPPLLCGNKAESKKSSALACGVNAQLWPPGDIHWPVSNSTGALRSCNRAHIRLLEVHWCAKGGRETRRRSTTPTVPGYQGMLQDARSSMTVARMLARVPKTGGGRRLGIHFCSSTAASHAQYMYTAQRQLGRQGKSEYCGRHVLSARAGWSPDAAADIANRRAVCIQRHRNGCDARIQRVLATHSGGMIQRFVMIVAADGKACLSKYCRNRRPPPHTQVTEAIRMSLPDYPHTANSRNQDVGYHLSGDHRNVTLPAPPPFQEQESVRRCSGRCGRRCQVFHPDALYYKRQWRHAVENPLFRSPSPRLANSSLCSHRYVSFPLSLRSASSNFSNGVGVNMPRLINDRSDGASRILSRTKKLHARRATKITQSLEISGKVAVALAAWSMLGLLACVYTIRQMYSWMFYAAILGSLEGLLWEDLDLLGCLTMKSDWAGVKRLRANLKRLPLPSNESSSLGLQSLRPSKDGIPGGTQGSANDIPLGLCYCKRPFLLPNHRSRPRGGSSAAANSDVLWRESLHGTWRVKPPCRISVTAISKNPQWLWAGHRPSLAAKVLVCWIETTLDPPRWAFLIPCTALSIPPAPMKSSKLRGLETRHVSIWPTTHTLKAMQTSSELSKTPAHSTTRGLTLHVTTTMTRMPVCSLNGIARGTLTVVRNQTSASPSDMDTKSWIDEMKRSATFGVDQGPFIRVRHFVPPSGRLRKAARLAFAMKHIEAMVFTTADIADWPSATSRGCDPEESVAGVVEICHDFNVSPPKQSHRKPQNYEGRNLPFEV
ncbi:uncharacterized protein MYCFIDRAFT_177318 [Pseudocercospora fijiensis CIRAD86]|uniref:Uncharacterized protein n=1 Tax=Pseudocercospora fijiensis (strain CIRAD86) TaxID=383855 RepID=M2ZMQ4_PSEFD|nr:uncharacterized protein MYCFIDRAFT_177318 [Pseudocercospora fijiensis CIRAD86]EME80374.1 hypothetical protein MYCFIDRAFT_177318 [Pseudocercospora fijiensis CIRAD86]